MSFLSKLEIDGETMNVLDFHCKVEQNVDKSGKPSADPSIGDIVIVVESTKSTLLFDWMISNIQTKNGKLTFFRRDAISKMRELEFNDAYCISYNESFNANTNLSMQIEFSISCKEIIMNGSKLSRNWPPKI